MNSRSFAFVCVIPVGPSALDRHRCADLIDSIRCGAPTAAHTYLVHDGHDGRVLRQLVGAAGLPGSVAAAPRTGRGLRWSSRLALGLSHAYRRALREFPGHAICRPDTDALVVRPFAETATCSAPRRSGRCSASPELSG